MKKNIVSFALVTIAASTAMASTAHAADGTIDFTGSIVGQTCVINGGNGGNNFTVALPAVSTSSLAKAGEFAGRTAFAIKLTNCSPDTGKVQVYFEPGPTVNMNNGNLIVDAGGAKNVEIGLLNQGFTKIKVGAPVASQNSQSVNITAGAANLNYFAQYEAVAAATAGPANSRVQYTLIYQ